MKTLVWSLPGAALLILATACGQQATPPTPQPSPTSPAPVVAQQYGTVEELRNAAVEWGYVCNSWVQDNIVTNAAESGHCSDDDVFSTFATDADLQATLSDLRSMRGRVDTGMALLVGPNWIINTSGPDIARLAVKLGGVVER